MAGRGTPLHDLIVTDDGEPGAPLIEWMGAQHALAALGGDVALRHNAGDGRPLQTVTRDDLPIFMGVVTW